jgi:predicted nucleic acid-binding protein
LTRISQIYAHDVDASGKHRIAKHIPREPWNQKAGALSPPSLLEFYVNVTRKIANPLPKKAARDVVHDFASWCSEMTSAKIATAFRIEDQAHDSLILVAALKSGATRILSEDLNAGQISAGIRIENPCHLCRFLTQVHLPGAKMAPATLKTIRFALI